MTTPFRCSATQRIGGILLAALATFSIGLPAPAAAQGFFESLFGAGPPSRRDLPSHASSYANDSFGFFGEPRRRPSGESSGGYSHGTAFCVRTCDGRYFPLQRHSNASPVELCRSFCPASKTLVFSGSKIDTAVAANGSRYADLDSAFVYRDKVVDNCTCNGKDALGLARVETTGDPTLRAGDIVATDEGLATFHGKNKSAEFTPINPSSSEWARKLSEIKVRPAPPSHPVAAVASDEAKPVRKGRRQAAR